jgi:hypothetical protein
MSAVPLVIVAIVLSLGMQTPSPKPTPPPTPSPSSTQPETKPQPKPDPKLALIAVQIVVGTQPNLNALCKKGGQAPSTVFVVSATQVFHCVGNSLHDHANHGKDPDLEKAVVSASAKERVRWFSATRFIVTSVEKHEPPAGAPPKKNVAPDYPFLEALPKEFRNEVIVTVRDEPGTVVQRYKASFNIEGIGLVDPDLICMM